jgi:hypothetical protein
MLSTDNPAAPHAPITPPEISLTWTLTETYTSRLALASVARVVGRGGPELAADPSSLLGGVGHQLADLLSAHQYEDNVVGVPEVEIVGADFTHSPTLADLVYAGVQTLRAESDANQHSDAGRALAALLAGLRREGITDR